MGKIVVSEFVSLDGVFEDPGGAESFEHGGWTFKFDRGDDGNKFKLDELRRAGAQLLGRITYEGFASAWPSTTDDVGFAEKMNQMPKYVVSSTLLHAGWNNSSIMNGDVFAGVSDLKAQIDGDILIAGSGQLVRGLMKHDLVDEYRLMIFPIVLGTGKRLFADDTEARTLELVESRPVGSDGVLILKYRAARQRL